MRIKKFVLTGALTLCILGVTACGYEPEHKITDPLPDKFTTEEELAEQEATKADATKEDTKTTEEKEEATTERDLDAEYEEWKAGVLEDRDKALEEQKTTESLTTETTTETVDPYSGLAVSKVHDVTVPAGTDYNTVIDKIIDGCTAYPNTYPVIDNVDLNAPGTYTCAWVRMMDDGTYVPLNYATFTVTVTAPAN